MFADVKSECFQRSAEVELYLESPLTVDGWLQFTAYRSGQALDYSLVHKGHLGDHTCPTEVGVPQDFPGLIGFGEGF